ncbi:MAG: RsmD family RNA methyltransferase [Alphaproteobacteria bacterium]|nr:RsmD family RNA methyltransferase [Alphaproteobacteria bacterium]OJV14250.1 MAG: hypothetical protein BGO27_01975 [Alphaproteobacteria bacterium 33-17]
MRVISGKLKGKKLDAGAPSLGLRPTKSDAKEALFSIINSRYSETLEDANVLDLCSGSGAIGLEFISRGANSVTFVDKDHLDIIRKNVKHCNVESQTRLVNWNVLDLPLARKPYDFIFFDPPYDNNIYEGVQKELLEKNYLSDKTVLIIESYTKIDYQVLDEFEVELVKNYGVCRFTFLKTK